MTSNCLPHQVEELRLNRGDPERAAQFLWVQVSATLIATDYH